MKVKKVKMKIHKNPKRKKIKDSDFQKAMKKKLRSEFSGLKFKLLFIVNDCLKLAFETSMSFSKKFTPSVFIGGSHAPSEPLDGFIDEIPHCLKKSITSIKIWLSIIFSSLSS